MSRILVIDDDPGTLWTYGVVLCREGYDVATAPAALEGLALLRNQQFDLVLADLRLPHTSGLEILSNVRQRGPDVPVVIVTGWGTIREAVAAMRLGAADFMEKPLFYDDLVRVVRDNLRYCALAQGMAQSDAAVLQDAGPAACRWAKAVMTVARSEVDVSTVVAWARKHGVGHGTLKSWCAAAHVRAKDSLNFARALRVVLHYSGQALDVYALLDVVDPRTARRLIERGGVSTGDNTVPDVPTFLRRQQFITASALLRAVRALLAVPQSTYPF